MADLAKLTVEVTDKGVLITAKSLRKLTTEATGAGTATDKLNAKNKNLNKTLKDSKRSLLDQSSAFKIVGRDMSRYFTIPLLAAAGASLKFGNDFYSGLAGIETLIPDTAGRIDDLGEAIKDTAVESGKSFSDLTDGMYQVISAFQDSEDTIARYNTVVKAAVAGNASTRSSLELLSAVTKGYDDTTASAVDRVADLAFETIRLGQTTFPELAASIQKVTSLSSELGVSQEELFSVFATLTGVTGDAAEVSTQYRAILASLMRPTATLAKLYKELGVESGKGAVEQFGFGQTISLIVETAKKSDIPLQSFIRRINGIVGAQALAGAQADTFIAKLEEIEDAAGAADKALHAVTDGVNRFGHDIKKARGNLANVGVEIYDVIIPALTSLVTRIADVGQKFLDADSMTQQWLIRMLGVVAATGPVLIAVGSFLRLVQLLSVVGISVQVALAGLIAIFAALAIAVALYSKHVVEAREEQEALNEGLQQLAQDANSRATSLSTLSKEYKGMTDQQEVNRHLNEELIRLYPELDGLIDTHITKVGELESILAMAEAREALKAAPNIYATQIADAKEFADTIKYAEDKLAEFRAQKKELVGGLDEGEELTGLALSKFQDAEAALVKFGALRKEAEEGIVAIAETADLTAHATGIDAYFTKYGVGFRLLADMAGDTSDEINKELAEAPILSDASKNKGLKTWEEWFEAITDVAIERFSDLETIADDAGNTLIQAIAGTGKGKLAGEAFMSDLQGAIEDKKMLADITGITFDMEGELGSMSGVIESAILRLMAIKKEAIASGKAFEWMDNSITILTDGLIDTEEKFKDIQKINFLKTIRDEIDALDDYNIALGQPTNSFDMLGDKVKIYQDAVRDSIELTGEDSETTKGLVEDLARLGNAYAQTAVEQKKLADTKSPFEQAKEDIVDVSELIREDLFDAFRELGDITDGLALVLADITIAIANMAGQQALAGIESFGNALAMGADAGETFRSVLAEMAMSILEILPMLFIQAGLQLIGQGQTAVGLGLIAAGLSSSFILGITKGVLQSEEENATANANGNAFSGGNIVEFAKGGSFTNSIVDTPTMFQFGGALGKLGVMGEKSAEAILPLSRTSSGELGVKTTGSGGSNVVVNIINNSNAQVETSEKETPDGKEIEVVISTVVKQGLANGNYDDQMSSRYGTNVKGIAS